MRTAGKPGRDVLYQRIDGKRQAYPAIPACINNLAQIVLCQHLSIKHLYPEIQWPLALLQRLRTFQRMPCTEESGKMCTV